MAEHKIINLERLDQYTQNWRDKFDTYLQDAKDYADELAEEIEDNNERIDETADIDALF